MAVQIWNDIDLHQTEALNILIHVSNPTSRPNNPIDKQVTFDELGRCLMSYNVVTDEWEAAPDPHAVQTIEGTSPIQVSRIDREVIISVDEATTTTQGTLILAGDLGGTSDAPEVLTVGGATAANVADAVDLRHNQNTDTGTDASTFQIATDNNGPRIANNNGDVALRNADNTDFVNLHVKNLVVQGDVTQIDSNEVNIGDNEIVLNADIDASNLNSDGGVAIKRLQSDDSTRGDAKVTFNNSTGRWQVTDGPVAAPTTFELSRKKSFVIGDGTNADIVLTHNLNTRDVDVAIRETNSPYRKVYTDVEMTTTDTVTIRFKLAPASGAYTATIFG